MTLNRGTIATFNDAAGVNVETAANADTYAVSWKIGDRTTDGGSWEAELLLEPC